MWIWTCRPGFEADLSLELSRARCKPESAGPSLLRSPSRPSEWPVFARAGFALQSELPPEPGAIASALIESLRRSGEGRLRAWLLRAWVPDADATNPLAARADSLQLAVIAELERAHPETANLRVERPSDAVRLGGLLGQLCLAGEGRVLVGSLRADQSPTLAPGGRARVRVPHGAPSRAARKLVEAIDWIGRSPEPGELCVDLGAAPGGWTVVLLERRARVIAVDPARLAPALRQRRGLLHVQRSAFEFVPDEPADWLFCDMAWRPMEVAALLAKWARRRWARALCANVKLPMKQRVEFVQRVCDAVAAGGWRELRARQLYHDREEFTLTAWRS